MANWTLNAGDLLCKGRPVIGGMANELSVEPDECGHGVFLMAAPASHHMWSHFVLGQVDSFLRYAALCVRADGPYWDMPSAGSDLAKLPPQACWLLVERTDGLFTMIVPIPAADECHYLAWRDGALNLYAENGDLATPVAGGLCAYVSQGPDMNALIEEGAASVSKRIPTAKLRRSKKTPRFADKFGWCTWNAFYGDVSHDKVRAGLETLKQAGVPPRAMILDDGWQQTEPTPTGGRYLSGLGANDKFPGGLKNTVNMAKGEFGIEDFLVWHAVSGYWKGVSPTALPKYKAKTTPPALGRYNNMQGVFDWQDGQYAYLPVKKYGDLYEDYHASLAAEGVDGVKVDNQASLAFRGTGNGGRTRLFKTMRDALQRSVAKHFDGQLISCMAHAPEVWYHDKIGNIVRGSDDFFPLRSSCHGLHLYTNAMNGAWFGTFSWIDWDMFESTNPFAPYHAAGRAVSGSPIYIADKPGEHDAALIRKLVFSDGSVARCQAPGRPTPDCIFHDLYAEHLALKVYGTTEYGTAVGLFDVETDKDTSIEAGLSPSDVPGLNSSRYAVWFHEAKRCNVIDRADRVFTKLGSRKYEVASLVPVRFGCLAIIGLVDMFNASAAVTAIKRGDDGVFSVSLRDGGTFAAWTKTRPKTAWVSGKVVPFEWNVGVLTVAIPKAGACDVSLRFE